jgi:hypothetical protein
VLALGRALAWRPAAATSSAPCAVIRSWSPCCTAFALYALGNAVFVGATEIARFTPPPRALRLASAFRSSGRFFWPAYYAITFGLVAWTARRVPPRGALGPAAGRRSRSTSSRRRSAPTCGTRPRSQPAAFVDARVAALAARAQRLFVYPSYECTRDDDAWPHPESWRASVVELQLATSDRALPSNSAYVSRAGRTVARRSARSDGPFERGTLSVVRRTDVPDLAERLGARAECLGTEACDPLPRALSASQPTRTVSARTERAELLLALGVDHRARRGVHRPRLAAELRERRSQRRCPAGTPCPVSPHPGRRRGRRARSSSAPRRRRHDELVRALVPDAERVPFGSTSST